MDILHLLDKEEKLGYTDSAVFGGLSAYLAARSQLANDPALLQLAQAYGEAALQERPRLLALLRAAATAGASATEPQQDGNGAKTAAERTAAISGGTQQQAAPGETIGQQSAPEQPSKRGDAPKAVQSSGQPCQPKRQGSSLPQRKTTGGAAAQSSGAAPAEGAAAKAAAEQPVRRKKQAAKPAATGGNGSLDTPVQYLKSVGQRRAAALAKLGVHTVGDLLLFFPRQYQDWRQVTPIGSLQIGENALLRGQVLQCHLQPTRSKLTLLKAVLADDSGVVSATWFNQRYLEKELYPGRELLLLGRLEIRFREPQFTVEDFYFADLPGAGQKIQPIYPATEGLSQKNLRALTEQAIARYGTLPPELLPDWLLQKYQWPGRAECIRELHYPTDFDRLQRCRRRMAYEEWLILQLAVLQSGNAQQRAGQTLHRPTQNDGALLQLLAEALPYSLTQAQNRVIGEIFADLNRPQPMARLVQGDVGCGKTMVAAAAMLKTCLGGRQAALMAPTEILAQQHSAGLLPLLQRFGVAGAELTGSTPAREKKQILSQFSLGELQVLIGTHALLEDHLVWFAPGLAVTDEQHRFGVLQRAKLAGEEMDTLVMSATPIPRTLAMTVYADLAMSVIDQMPPGRKPVKTYAVNYSYEQRVYNFMEKELLKGRQAFVVCPLIEESETLDLDSAKACFGRLQQRFTGYQVGLLHGKMKAAEKRQIMEDFQQNRLQILVSTTVIEVGVDVPNATVMLIRDAERFGLAQLHQLRGRIGRGGEQGYCLLLHSAAGQIARQRMKTIASCTDGFQLAEADLQQRGPGEFFGLRQHGLPQLKVADLLQDGDLLQQAREDCAQLLQPGAQYPPALQQAVAEKLRYLSS